MQNAYIWLIVAIGLGIAEMLTGTFFLLVLAIAGLAGAAVAWAGFGFWLQAGVAALIAVIGVQLVRARRRTESAPMPSLDVGQPVNFETWVNREHGMARVNYRGASWEARLSPDLDPAPGAVLYIEASEGNVFRLVADKPTL